jgi:hypothetical protein
VAQATQSDVRVWCAGNGLNLVSDFIREHPSYSKEAQIVRVLAAVVVQLAKILPSEQSKLIGKWKEENKHAVIAYLLSRTNRSICTKMRTIITFIHNSSGKSGTSRIEATLKLLTERMAHVEVFSTYYNLLTY